jgi:hypothetical protein
MATARLTALKPGAAVAVTCMSSRLMPGLYPLTGNRIQQDKEAAYHTLNNAPMVETNEPVAKENMVVADQGPVQG